VFISGPTSLQLTKDICSEILVLLILILLKADKAVNILHLLHILIVYLLKYHLEVFTYLILFGDIFCNDVSKFYNPLKDHFDIEA
jgi:hypothetical protein